MDRRIKWMAKFAYLEIDTQRTIFQWVPGDTRTYFLPGKMKQYGIHEIVPDREPYPQIIKLEPRLWGFCGRHRNAEISFAYSPELDVCIVNEVSYRMWRT
jgi:hypothetical protein